MRAKMKRLISRLIQWLKNRGLTEADILECIEYITK